MKKNYALIFFIVFLFFTKASAQNYNNIVNFNFNNSITNGMKITTTLPFTGSSEMPTIEIKGYNYGAYKSIGLIISYYIYSVNGVLTFIDCSVSSFGGYTPSVSLSNENGYVVIFINDKPYFPRFTVSAFAQGMSADISSSYTGWTVTDAGLSGTATATTILP